jgi:predicted porin
MKKSLLALAALTAFAGAASAQSSVTLFGIIDLSVGQIDNGQTDKFMMMGDGNASNRLGFRGTEDLGGGLRAQFHIETGFQPDSTSTNLNFARKTTVALLGNWGEVRLGRDYTPQFYNWSTFDVFGTNGLGSALNLRTGVETSGNNQNFATLTRADNMVSYLLPAIGGLYGQVSVAAGEGVESTGAPGNKMIGGRIGWAAGPFNVAGAWSETKVTAAQDMTHWNVGGSWQAGPFRVTGFYSNIQLDNSANLDQTNWYVGGSWALGAATLKASYGAVDRDSNVGGCGTRTSCDATMLAIGGHYDLSKRTALYATYSVIDNDGTPFRVYGDVNALPAISTEKNQGYQFGVRHSF